MRFGSVWDVYALDVTHEIEAHQTQSTRAAIYSFARRRKLHVKAYIREEDSVVVFRLSRTPIKHIEGEPPRGSKAHKHA